MNQYLDAIGEKIVKAVQKADKLVLFADVFFLFLDHISADELNYLFAFERKVGLTEANQWLREQLIKSGRYVDYRGEAIPLVPTYIWTLHMVEDGQKKVLHEVHTHEPDEAVRIECDLNKVDISVERCDHITLVKRRECCE